MLLPKAPLKQSIYMLKIIKYNKSLDFIKNSREVRFREGTCKKTSLHQEVTNFNKSQ